MEVNVHIGSTSAPRSDGRLFGNACQIRWQLGQLCRQRLVNKLAVASSPVCALLNAGQPRAGQPVNTAPIYDLLSQEKYSSSSKIAGQRAAPAHAT